MKFVVYWQREIFYQIKKKGTKEYFVYFKFLSLQS